MRKKKQNTCILYSRRFYIQVDEFVLFVPLSSIMHILLFILLVLIALYHLLMTGLSAHWPAMKVILPLIRDGLRIAIVIIISLLAVRKA